MKQVILNKDLVAHASSKRNSWQEELCDKAGPPKVLKLEERFPWMDTET